MLPEDHKSKVWWQFKAQGAELLRKAGFEMYGLGHEIPGVMEELANLAIQAHKNLNGLPEPVTIEHAKARGKRRKRKR